MEGSGHEVRSKVKYYFLLNNSIIINATRLKIKIVEIRFVAS